MGAEWPALYVRIRRLALLLLLATALPSSFAQAWQHRFAARWIWTRGRRIFFASALLLFTSALLLFASALPL